MEIKFYFVVTFCDQLHNSKSPIVYKSRSKVNN